MAESEDYSSSLKHGRATQSYHNPTERDAGAEEQLVATWGHCRSPSFLRPAPGSTTSRSAMDTMALLTQHHFLPPLLKK